MIYFTYLLKTESANIKRLSE